MGLLTILYSAFVHRLDSVLIGVGSMLSRACFYETYFFELVLDKSYCPADAQRHCTSVRRG